MQQGHYQPVGQPPVTIVAQPTTFTYPPDKYQASAKSQMSVLSIVQIVMGVLALAFGIVLAVMDRQYTGSVNHFIGIQGYGIWCGLYFMVVGGVGIASVKSNTSGWIITVMILNIVSSVIFCWSLLGYSSAGIVITATSCSRSYSSYSSSFSSYSSYSSYRNCPQGIRNTYLAMDSLLLVISFIQLIITIWSAVLCCTAVCNCCKSSGARPVVQQQVITTYPIAQTGVTVHHQGYAAPPGGYVGQPVPMYQQQPQVPPTYPAQPQGPPAYTVAGQPGAQPGAYPPGVHGEVKQ